MEIIVGRKALYHNLGKRAPQNSDLDVWTDNAVAFVEFRRQGVDSCLMPERIMDTFHYRSVESGYACMKDLLAIKLSHLPYDNNWWKHAQDALFLMNYQWQGEYNLKLYEALKPYWVEKFGNKEFLNLDRKKDQFFDDFVPKQHDHDYLHTLVAKDGIPLYTKCLKDGCEVMIDKEKFLSLSHTERVRMLKEEVAVIALERYIIPSLTNPKLPSIVITQAWNSALRKTVTRLTKGFYSEFMCIFLKEFLHPLQEEMLFALSKLNLKEKYMENQEYTFNDLENLYKERGGEYFTFIDFLLEGGEDVKGFDFVEQDGGFEGGSEDCYSVIKVDGQLYKINYNYYSHCGFETYHASVKKAKPVKRVVTFYE